VEPQALPILQSNQPVAAGFFDSQSFDLIQRVAKAFASSNLVPSEYRNNIANCMIALNLSKRTGSDPLMTMQNLTVVHGRPTWSSQFLIASVNICGRFTALRYEFFGAKGQDDWGCRAWAVEKSTGEKLLGSDITIALAKKEGWYGRNGSKWHSMPQQMLIYRAGAWWARAYAPELSMGLMTADEAEDAIDLTRKPDGTFAVAAALPRTIQAALDTFAGEPAETQEIAATDSEPPAETALDSAVEADDNSGGAAPTTSHGSVAAEEQQETAAVASLPVSATESDATPNSNFNPIELARQRGREAAEAGLPRTIPTELRYKSRLAEKDAFVAGYDEIADALVMVMP